MTKEIESFMQACRTGYVDKLSKAIASGIDVESLDENKIIQKEGKHKYVLTYEL